MASTLMKRAQLPVGEVGIPPPSIAAHHPNRVMDDRLRTAADGDDGGITMAVAGRRNGSASDRPLIWDARSETFSVSVFKQAMLVRGFTPDSLARASRLGRATLYNALAGRRIRIRTARVILEAMAAVEPAFRLIDLS